MATPLTQPGGLSDRRRRPAGSHVILDRIMANIDGGVSDAELALLLGVSRQTVYNRRVGKRRMSEADMRATADVLGFPVQLFLGSVHDALQWLIDNDRLTRSMGDFAWNTLAAA